MREYCFGLDLGGTTCKVGLIKTTGEIVEKWEIPTDTSNNGENILKILSKAYQEWLIKDIKGTEMDNLRNIREWLILNTRCSKPVYIDKEYIIHSEGEIVINADAAQHIPEYIKITSTAK